MARRAHAYPQVVVTAADVADAAVASAPAGVRVGEALALARKHDAVAVAAGEACVLREDLVRAVALGLGSRPAEALARPVPAVGAAAGEVTVRRFLAAGAPLVLVREGPGRLRAVRRRPDAVPGPALADRIARAFPDEARRMLASVRETAAALGVRAWLVGGPVRDLWRGAGVGGDLDVVVEGDGLRLAHALARRLGARVVEHRRFLTASLRTPDGRRLDVATARSERYETPGALPRVVPAPIGRDLERRDFTVNAMAVELGSDAFALLDPLGGRADLARRRLRALHPLSFVEDPTRILRAARYATRLGLAVEGATARWRALALELAPYPALSGQRIAAELERALREERAAAVLRRLGAARAFRLLDPRHRVTRLTRAHLDRLPAALAWARERALAVAPVELLALALADGQPAAVASAVLQGLALTGEPLARARRALAEAPALVRALAAAARPSRRAAALRGRSPLELAWLWLAGGELAGAAVDWFLGLAPAADALRGEDLLALGVPRGPAVARLLAELRDGRLDGTLPGRAAEIDHVRGWIQTRKEG